MVERSASISSRVRNSEARSQISGGSVTWASQSKVAKVFVIGAKRWTGMVHPPFFGSGGRIVLQPAWWFGDDIVASEHRIDRGHVVLRDCEAKRAKVFLHL